jgi:hypothetical protein
MSAFYSHLKLFRGETHLYINFVTSGAQFAKSAFG